MDSSWRWKVALTVFITLACVWFLIPTYYSMAVLPKEQRNDIAALEKALPAWAPPAKYRLNLGLDLQGGIHMVMRVDTETALAAAEVCRLHKLAPADAIVFAAARAQEAALITCDAHFDGLPGVTLIEKVMP